MDAPSRERKVERPALSLLLVGLEIDAVTGAAPALLGPHHVLGRDAVPVTLRILPLVGGVVAAGAGAGRIAVLALLDHGLVLADAVAVLLRDVRVGAHAVGGGGPGQVVATDLDVVVGELAQLVVVHAEQLGLLGGAQRQAGDVVDGVGEQGGDDEAVRGAGHDVGDLDVELLVVADGEAADAGPRVDAVEPDDVVDAHQRVEDEADHAGQTVLGEDVHAVVDAHPVLDLGAEIAEHAGHDAEGDGAPGVEVAGGRGGGHEAGDGAGTPADHGELAGQAPVEEDPGHRGHGGGEVGVPRGHDRAQVGAEGGAAVEAEPAEPQEDGAEEDEGDVVRAEVEHHLLLALAEHKRVGEHGHAGGDLDGPAAGVVHDAVHEAPAVGIPGPAGDGVVDDRGPAEGPDEEGQDTAALGHGAYLDGGCDGAELHLVEGVEQGRHQRRARTGLPKGVLQAEVV